MINETDMTSLEKILSRYQIDKKTISLIKQSWSRINAIGESNTFRYEPLEEFERKLSQLNKLKEAAMDALRLFADRHHTSLCAPIGVPMRKYAGYHFNSHMSVGHNSFQK